MPERRTIKHPWLDLAFYFLVSTAFFSIPFILIKILMDYRVFSPAFLEKSFELLPWAWGLFFSLLGLGVVLFYRFLALHEKKITNMKRDAEKERTILLNRHRAETKHILEDSNQKIAHLSEKFNTLYSQIDTRVREEVRRKELDLKNRMIREHEANREWVENANRIRENHPVTIQLRQNFLALKEISSALFHNSSGMVLSDDEMNSILVSLPLRVKKSFFLNTPFIDSALVLRWAGFLSDLTSSGIPVKWSAPWSSHKSVFEQVLRTNSSPPPFEFLDYIGTSLPCCIFDEEEIFLFPIIRTETITPPDVLHFVSRDVASEYLERLKRDCVNVGIHYGKIESIMPLDGDTLGLTLSGLAGPILIRRNGCENEDGYFQSLSRRVDALYVLSRCEEGVPVFFHILLPEGESGRAPESSFDLPVAKLPF